MRYYCPNCWRECWNVNFAECPQCGFRIEDFNQKEYVDKLLTALGHPSGEVRHWVIMILADKKEQRAIPFLEKLTQESKDPSIVRAAQEAIRTIRSPGDPTIR